MSQDFRPDLKGSLIGACDVDMENIILNKIEIRKSIRNQRKQLLSSVVAQASLQVTEKISHLPEFQNAKNIAYYISHENEIDLSSLARHATELNKSLYLPVFSDEKKLAFYAVDANTQFQKDKWGIEEPVVSKQWPVKPSTLDLILIPMVAFDAQCNRLGRGAGCYDRYLSFTKNIVRDKRPVLIGVAYEFQRVDEIISECWDVSMDFIVTEKSIYE